MAMDDLQAAFEILRNAEEGLRRLIERGLVEQRYADVARVAEMAEWVAELTRRRDSGEVRDISFWHGRGGGRTVMPLASSSENVTKLPIRQASGKRNQEYPRFERDGDRLIKVGWSKKNREIYEHRAPKTAIVRFGEHLASRIEPGAVFAMDEVLPVPDGYNGEIPSYQAYIALAWLRSTGTVERKGRDGYVYSEGAIGSGALEDLWAALPERT